MAEKNKSYRIRTTVGREADSFLEVHLDQDYDSLEILSLKISDKDTYKLHNSDYGVIVGRVLANGNFGVPNAKISVFIPADEQNSSMEMWNLYPYTSTSVKNDKDIRYNLLPDESVKDCHKAVGTFPHKTYLLENDALLEVFDKYYLYTTRTNAAGDYLICGVPTGMQTLHMDLDLSDCGILSQRPRDFVYKGYTIEQFDNPNQFKKDENIDSLAQIFSQDQPVYVQPFWGNEENGEEIGITRADIQISFKFEPTCVFMGSAISDNASNGVGKKCVPTNQMGAMDELTAGEGTIEMIRKTPGGHVEEFAIKGNQLINGNGVWCYQIPMNLDYMMTDEYGHMVPTDDPEKGIPTRARVRFRASLTDMDGSSQSYYRAKYLIPNNPGIEDKKVDYNFGTYTEEDSYRDLFWNGVYTVKSYIPRFQKSKRWRSERFSGIKGCNYYGGNNPVPYNNMRIRLPFMFTVLCIFVKLFIKIVTLVNRIIGGVLRVIAGVVGLIFSPLKIIGKALQLVGKLLPKVGKLGDSIMSLVDGAISLIINPFIKKYGIHCTFIGDGLCPDMEGWYFAPGCTLGDRLQETTKLLMKNTLAAAQGSGDNLEDLEDDDVRDSMNSSEFTDETSVDVQNTSSSEEESVCLTRDVNYLVNCFEMNLAQEYRVIKFDFYNDWVNGVLYFPRWMRKVKRKKKYKLNLGKGLKNLITTYYKDKVQGCMNAENSRVKKSRYYTQQCSLSYKSAVPNTPWNEITTSRNCYNTPKSYKKGKKKNKDGQEQEDESLFGRIVPAKCHKKQGIDQSPIFGKKSGLVTEETTMLGQFVYYLKPCEWKDTDNGRVRTLLFATDLVLLGTLNDCDENGIPQSFKYLNNSSYIMPTNLALTTMDDDAYIYAANDGTVCSSKGSRSQSNANGGTQQDSVLRVTPDYNSTYSAYSQTDGDVINYEENDDPVPVTESAGITWNYAGPGQDDVNLGTLEDSQSFLKRLFGAGNRRFSFLYYPGGHFLGLSCTSSESNIKSCVNLKRICEVGATMSQRREEVRSYTDNGEGKYKVNYRYYVPTGLISNVDIEGASFRSMFATLNHNKLVATLKNETTGYKKYDFRFLRPDGFDGSLSKVVHQNNSPYNKKVITNDTPDALTDSRGFFESMFGGIWQVPDDYDAKELDYTERRTIEDSVDDYYMFRFGLDGFSDKEQKRHYLSKGVNGGYRLPQYENSFYFYFGLKDGSTALDEFKKQFFSECESNIISKAPAITVKEKIDSDLSGGKATVIIDNMLPNYTIVITDNTRKTQYGPFTVDTDVFKIEAGGSLIGGGLQIGHEYTITVTDSLDNTISKTFTFGASAVKIDIQAVHFRTKAPLQTAGDAKKGGFIKINDTLHILKKEFHIDQGISFKYAKVVDGIPGGFVDFPSVDNYTDASGEKWYLYFLKDTGTYDIALYYEGNLVSIYTATVDDNKRVNLFVSCDWMAYKPEYLGGNDYADCYTPLNPVHPGESGLKEVINGNWYNSANEFQFNIERCWIMRHTFYRQTENDRLAYDNFVYSKGRCDIAIFGQPEKMNASPTSVKNAVLNGTGIDARGSILNNYINDYNSYPGYVVDDTYTFIPTMFYDWNNKLEIDGTFRNAFDAMSYTDDGRAAADASGIAITGYTYANGTITLRFSGSDNGVVPGHGCVVVFENGEILFPVVSADGSSMNASSQDIYPNRDALETGVFEKILSMATVYPTLRVPSVYKPFYGVISAATWELAALSLSSNENGETVAEKNELPTSFKVEGDIYNGLTFNNQFSRASVDGDSDIGTYMIFKNSDIFWTKLTADTQSDFQCKRKIYSDRRFGQNEWNPLGLNDNFPYGREISAFTEDEKDINTIEYRIAEGVVPISNPGNKFTERYASGFDRKILKDSVSLEAEFFEGLTIKTLNANDGMNGEWVVYTEELPPSMATSLYITDAPIFIKENEPLTVSEGGDIFCCGYYNEKTKFDKKGELANVRKIGGKYSFSMTQENGAKVNKVANNEENLYVSGVTIYHRHHINPIYARNIEAFEGVVNNATVIRKRGESGNVSTRGNIRDPHLNGTGYNAIIAVYEKPDDGTRNKMTVYRLYPVGLLDVMFPAGEGGVEPYMSGPASATYNKDGQTVTIAISTNVSFRLSKGANSGWITLTKVDYDSTTASITFDLTANEDGVNRTGSVIMTCTDDGVELNPVTISIIQTKDEIAEVREDMQEMYEDLEGQIEDLRPSGDTGN